MQQGPECLRLQVLKRWSQTGSYQGDQTLETDSTVLLALA